MLNREELKRCLHLNIFVLESSKQPNEFLIFLNHYYEAFSLHKQQLDQLPNCFEIFTICSILYVFPKKSVYSFNCW